MVMDQQFEMNKLRENYIDENVPMTKRNDGEKSSKCNQCDYLSSVTSNLKRHLKRHSGVNSDKCNQCDSQTGDLRRHLKTHSGEKSNKCNQCDFASSRAGHLRRHLKTHNGEK